MTKAVIVYVIVNNNNYEILKETATKISTILNRIWLKI